MNVLELFSGTGSVGKVCETMGWDVVSVDLEMKATHQMDIMDFDYKQYPSDYFSIVWASPPCQNYSICKNCWLGRPLKELGGKIYTEEIREQLRQKSDKLVERTFEIIEYFKPFAWYVENPDTSDLKNRTVMKDKPYYIVDYCMYSNWGYRKRTRIWSNVLTFKPKLCDGSGDCGNMIKIENHNFHLTALGKTSQNKMVKKQHIESLGNGYEIINGEKVICNTKEKIDKLRQLKKDNKHVSCVQSVGGGTDRLMRYRIPPDLVYDLLCV
tara:strand:- start:467 stop:1273 length:807 start_codon:yes stop_codon:yes gene_type:complete